MQKQDKLIVYFLKSAFNSIPNKKNDEGNQTRSTAFTVILFLLCLFLTGSEAVKVFMRKKIGLGEISFIRMFLTTLFFILTAVLLIVFGPGSSESIMEGSLSYSQQSSFMFAPLFYLSLAGLMVYLGIYNKVIARKIKLPEMYPGNSRLFWYFERKSSLRRSWIRNFFDPLIFLLLGVAGMRFNLFLGLPLILSSISYWIVFCVEYTVGIEYLRLDAISEYESRNKISNPPSRTQSRSQSQSQSQSHSHAQKNTSSIENKW